MRLKSELYAKEQKDILDKIANILGINEGYNITLYELDNQSDTQKSIMDLIPEIRKYYSFTFIEGARDPKSSKRPYLSIIKNILKKEYNMISNDYTLKLENGDKIRTKRYFFLKLNNIT